MSLTAVIFFYISKSINTQIKVPIFQCKHHQRDQFGTVLAAHCFFDQDFLQKSIKHKKVAQKNLK